MRDGVRVAIDVSVPEGLAARAPAILRQTRYMRALAPRLPWPGSLAPEAFDLYARTRRVFLAAGYVWVDVDVRGSGASTGTGAHPWTMDEIKDGAEVVDWMIREPWSSGKVGSLGISYDGTAAEMLLVNQHPAVRAVAPLFSLFDAYLDVAFPGGVHLAWFTEAWARYNAALDRGAFGEASSHVVRLIARAAAVSPAPRGADRVVAQIGKLGARLDPVLARVLDAAVAGVAPVGGAAGLEDLHRAIVEHRANFSVHEGALKLTYRDDEGLSPATPHDTIDAMSPEHHARAIAGAGAAVYGYSGWRDAAYPNAAIKRHARVGGPGDRLTIGPWTHAGKQRIVPFGVAVPPSFDHDAEMLAFFDEHLKGKPREDAPRVRYYTFVEERWKTASTWPPPAAPVPLFLASGGRLEADTAPLADVGGDAGDDALAVSPTAGTGERSRWRSLLSLVPGDYPDRRERDRLLLTYEAPPLDAAIEVTGHPVAVLFVSWDADDDGRVFAYLEDVAPDGRVAYVTEGQLRALHRRTLPSTRRSTPEARAPGVIPARSFRRADAMPLAAREVGELAFELLPISWRFERGHRVRFVVAGGDGDHFARSRASILRVHRSASWPSRVELPIAAGIAGSRS
jgi:putative CocE/NonD family hydrolase